MVDAKPKTIIQVINEISKAAGALKPEKSTGVPFPFRGIDGVMNHLSAHIRDAGVVIAPNVVKSVVTTRELNGGKAITQTELEVAFTFYGPAGDSITVTTAGLAQDYSDRSTAQAHSVALRLALLETFFLPTDQPEPEVAGEATQKYIADAAKSAPAAPQAAQKADPAQVIQKKIGAIIGDTTNAYTPVTVNELGDKVTGKKRAVWFNNVADLEKVLKALENGEVA